MKKIICDYFGDSTSTNKTICKNEEEKKLKFQKKNYNKNYCEDFDLFQNLCWLQYARLLGRKREQLRDDQVLFFQSIHFHRRIWRCLLVEQCMLLYLLQSIHNIIFRKETNDFRNQFEQEKKEKITLNSICFEPSNSAA